MWGANNANDCMQLHNTKKSFDFGYFAPSYNASVHTPHTAFLHAMHMFIQLNHRTFHRLTAVKQSANGRQQIA